MKSLDLKSVNVQALNDDELRLVDGGNPIEVWEWLIDEVIAWVEDGGIGDTWGDPNTPGMYIP